MLSNCRVRQRQQLTSIHSSLFSISIGVVNHNNVRCTRITSGVGSCRIRLRCNTNLPLSLTCNQRKKTSHLTSADNAIFAYYACRYIRWIKLNERYRIRHSSLHFDVSPSAEFNLISWCIEFLMKEWQEKSILHKKETEKSNPPEAIILGR